MVKSKSLETISIKSTVNLVLLYYFHSPFFSRNLNKYKNSKISNYKNFKMFIEGYDNYVDLCNSLIVKIRNIFKTTSSRYRRL